MPAATPPIKTASSAKRNRESREIYLERIRAAAIAEFSLHGLRGATTDSIAHRAGMTRPQLHYYIAGKEELYEELLRTVLAQWAQDPFDHASNDPETVLRKYVADKVRQATERPELARLFGLEMLGGAPNLAAYWPQAVELTGAMVGTIERWIAEGRMRQINPHLLLMNIWAMSSHYAFFAVQMRVMSEAFPDARLDAEAVRDEVTRMVLSRCGFAPT